MTRLIPRTIVLALLVATACSDGTGPAAEIGQYDLTLVNNVALPAPLPFQPAEVTGGALWLEAGRTWRAEIVALVAFPGGPVPSTEIQSGTYTRSRNLLYFTIPGQDGTFTGVLAGGRITAIADGVSYAFDRK